MNLCWISMVLLSLGLSHAKDSDQQRTVCVASGASIFVHCPNLTSNDVIFHLLMGLQEIGRHRYNHNMDNATASAERPLRIKEGLELLVNKMNQSVSFVLSGVTTERVGFYTCEVTIDYPPPLKIHRSPYGVLVLVEGHQCKLRNTCDSTAGCREQPPIWVCRLGLGAASIYGLTVTIFAFVIWLKLRRGDSSHSDYMNTKPRAPRGHRKKKGVQLPVPRYF